MRPSAPSEVYFCLNLLERSLEELHAQRPLHPAVLEAYNMFQQLQAYRLESQQPKDEEFATKVTPDLESRRAL